ncbi:ATP-binding cassette domain-containing protein [Micromonospora sp. DH15]|nr:ATP-binding cassette domain-containing protein [Micromonospora sp. DH15]
MTGPRKRGRVLADLWMGARMAVTGGRDGWTRAALTALGVGIGVAMLLLAAAVPGALDARAVRNEARNDTGWRPERVAAANTVLVALADTEFRDHPVRGRIVRAEGPAAPVPPGLARLPGAGEVVVSPALRDLLDSPDGPLFAPRLGGGRVAGTIGAQGLAGPAELAFYLGSADLTDEWAVRRDQFGGGEPGEEFSPVLMVLVVVVVVVLLLPIVVFVGAAVRFGGDRRDRRLAALRLLGAGHGRIVGRHLLPLALGPCLVYASTDVGTVVLAVATLSFLGLGVAPPSAEWGQMLIEGRPFLASAWWLAYPPGVAITAVVFASNLLGERLAAGAERPSIIRLVRPGRIRRATRSVPSPDPGTVLRVRDLSVTYPDGSASRRVVAGMSYEVRRGQVLAFVGETGSGKTTAALAPFGLLDPSAAVTGSALLDTHELIGLAPGERRRINGRRVGVVFQDSGAFLNPLRTIGAHVDEAVRNAGRGGRRAATRRVSGELLRLAGLPDPLAVARQFPHQLSGGMRQRAQIAIALAGEPELLVADEPTSALDATVQAQLLDLLARLRDELGMAMIIVSHDLAVVSRVADTVAVVYGGRIVESGPATDLIDEPDHPYTRGLLDAVPRPRTAPGTRFRTMPGLAGGGPDDLAGCGFAPRCPLRQDSCDHEPPALQPLLPATAHRSACLHPPTREGSC